MVSATLTDAWYWYVFVGLVVVVVGIAFLRARAVTAEDLPDPSGETKVSTLRQDTRGTNV